MIIDKKKQQGVALIAAIFVVVIIGAALVVISTLAIRTSEQTTQNLLQLRAQYAAAAGIESMTQTLVEDRDASVCSEGSSATSSITVPAYSDFTVTIQCRYNRYNRTSQEIRIYELIASAEHNTPRQPDYVWVQLTASIEL